MSRVAKPPTVNDPSLKLKAEAAIAKPDRKINYSTTTPSTPSKLFTRNIQSSVEFTTSQTTVQPSIARAQPATDHKHVTTSGPKAVFPSAEQSRGKAALSTLEPRPEPRSTSAAELTSVEPSRKSADSAIHTTAEFRACHRLQGTRRSIHHRCHP